jgi:uncharacterized OsmC-like protein
MVQIDVTYKSGLRCEAVHGPSGQKILTDAPVDNQGKGEFFSPTDLVAAALGTCVATVMGIVAEREKIDLAGMKITVLKEMDTAGTRRIGKLLTRIIMPCNLETNQRLKLERAAHTCPVHESLRPEVEIPIEFVYP